MSAIDGNVRQSLPLTDFFYVRQNSSNVSLTFVQPRLGALSFISDNGAESEIWVKYVCVNISRSPGISRDYSAYIVRLSSKDF